MLEKTNLAFIIITKHGFVRLRKEVARWCVVAPAGDLKLG